MAVTYSLFLHNENDIGFFYNVYNDSYIDIVITSRDASVKFDVFHFFTGLNFFDEITYYYNYDESGQYKFAKSVTEPTTDERNYKMFGNKWKVAIPLVDEGRITGTLMMIRCRLKSTDINNKELALLELVTLIREYKL